MGNVVAFARRLTAPLPEKFFEVVVQGRSVAISPSLDDTREIARAFRAREEMTFALRSLYRLGKLQPNQRKAIADVLTAHGIDPETGERQA